MSEAPDNRWATDAYPDEYKQDIERALAFTGLEMDLFTRGKADSIVDLLERLHPGGAKAADCLDIGCGIGNLHPFLRAGVGRLRGADISADAIATARELNPAIDYRVYDGRRLPYEDATFDFCSTACVMHHVPPPQWPDFVAEAWRVTRPGGLFAVYEHNPLNPMTRIVVCRCPFDHDAVLLRARRVLALMRQAGFEPVLRQYLFFVPIDAPWARRVDRLLGWLPIGAQYVVCGRKPA